MAHYNPTSQFLWSFWEASATRNLGMLQVTVTTSINQVASDFLGDLSWDDKHSACLQTSGAHDSLHPCVRWSMDPTRDIQVSKGSGDCERPGCLLVALLRQVRWKLGADGLPGSAIVCACILPGLPQGLFSRRNPGQGKACLRV